MQLFRHHSPDVQNMVGFLAFIVFLVQVCVFVRLLGHPPDIGRDRGDATCKIQ